jgi:hypothetical protein
MKQRRKNPYEKGLANHSAPSFAPGIRELMAISAFALAFSRKFPRSGHMDNDTGRSGNWISRRWEALRE